MGINTIEEKALGSKVMTIETMGEKSSLPFHTTWIPQRADPFLTKGENGVYYFTASVPSYDRIVLRSAKHIEDLPEAAEVTIWSKHENGIMSEHVWAPELHYLFGGWYLYFAASDKDDIWALRPYVLKCTGRDPMKDPWVELGQMKCAPDDPFSFRAFSLDATVFCSYGSWYYIWAEKVSVGKQISNLYIARMKSANELETPQVLLTTPDYDWERVDFWVNEGPAVLHHDGKLFITYSASATGAEYCVGILTAREDADLLDPSSYKKSRYPVLQTSVERGIYGPGHNSFTTDEYGRTIMCYHARTTDVIVGDPLYNPNRHAMLMPVYWNEAGEPVFSYENT